MHRLIWILPAVAWLGCARTPTLDTQTFELHYLDAAQAQQMIQPYVYGDRPDAPGAISWVANTITVRETRDNLDKVARVLAEYDRPRPTVRLHFQLIEASDNAPTERFDPAIGDVVTELQKLFKYKSYQLLTGAVVGGSEGSHIEQVIGDPQDPNENVFRLVAAIGDVRGTGDSATVQLEVGVHNPMRGGLQTTVNARNGQTLVVGNAQLARGGGTVILTVTPELVQ